MSPLQPQTLDDRVGYSPLGDASRTTALNPHGMSLHRAALANESAAIALERGQRLQTKALRSL